MAKFKLFLRKHWITWTVIAALVLFDQVTKLTMESWLLTLPSNKFEVIPDFFNFRLAYNTGGGWSILNDNPMILLIASTAMIGGLIWWLSKNDHWFTRTTLIVLIAGALGNWIDRALYLHVIDFLQFFPFGYAFPIFNFADICITVGTAGFILDTFIEPRRKAHE